MAESTVNTMQRKNMIPPEHFPGFTEDGQKSWNEFKQNVLSVLQDIKTNEKNSEELSTQPEEEIKSNWKEIVINFGDMRLKKELLEGFFLHLKTPSGIQKQAITASIQGRNVIFEALSHTDRVLTFCISLLQQINTNVRQIIPECQALIITPTRSMAYQIREMILSLKGSMNVSCHVISFDYHNSERDTLQTFNLDAHILIGCPETINCLIKKRTRFNPSEIKFYVLDLADDLSQTKNFKDTHDLIFDRFSKNVQVSFYFQKIPNPDELDLSKYFIEDPVIIKKEENIALDDLHQFSLEFKNRTYKCHVLYDLLHDLHNQEKFSCQTIVFFNSSRKVIMVKKFLEERGLQVYCLRCEMKKSEKFSFIKEFKNDPNGILLTNDLLGYDNDFENVPLIINFNVPWSSSSYVQRVGGDRFRRKAVVISFTSPVKKPIIEEVERMYNVQMEWTKLDIVECED